jgi:hypothetical protein
VAQMWAATWHPITGWQCKSFMGLRVLNPEPFHQAYNLSKEPINIEPNVLLDISCHINLNKVYVICGGRKDVGAKPQPTVSWFICYT